MLTCDKVEKEFLLRYEGAQGGIGPGLTVFSPLKVGIVTGKYNDGVPDDSRISTSKDDCIPGLKKTLGNENWQNQLAIVRNLKPVADELSCTQAPLALMWVLKNLRVSYAITGASKVSQVYASLDALKVVPTLTNTIMDEIDGVLGIKHEPLPARYF